MKNKSINNYKSLSEKIIKIYNDDEYYKNYFKTNVLGKHIVNKDGDADEKEIESIQVITLPFLKFVTNSISQLYSKPVLRSINSDNQDLLDILKEVTTSYDEIAEEVDKYTFAGGMTALKPHYDDEDRTFEYVLYTANMIDYTPRADDYSKLKELYLTFFYDNVRQEEVWSKEEYNYLNDGSNVVSEENIYGFIPFEIFRNKKIPNSFYCPPSSNLLDIQDYISNQNTQLGNNFKFQSMDMIVVKGGADLKEMNFGAKAVNKVDTEDDIKFVSPNTDLEKLVNVINEQIFIFARMNGIPDSLISAATTTSGVSLIISQKALDDYLKNRATKFRKTEENLLLKGIKVLAYHRGINVPEDLKVSLNYTAANQMSKITEDEIKMWEFYLEKNILTRVDLMITMFPNMTRKEAEEKILENLELDEIISMFKKEIIGEEDTVNTENIKKIEDKKVIDIKKDTEKEK